MESGSDITIYSQNLSCDSWSVRLIEIEGMKEYTFKKRMEKLVDQLPEGIDVVALNEIRHKDNKQFLLQSLINKGFDVRFFANNDSDMTFHNLLAISKASSWRVMEWRHAWAAVDEHNTPTLKDKLSKINGDAHGRCAGVVYLKHEKSGIRVCVLTSHVVPFGEAKSKQQEAIFSLNEKNLASNPPVATIIVGDVNRFSEEVEEFDERLTSYQLREAHPTALKITMKDEREFSYEDKKDVGTFSPWPNDKNIYVEKLQQTMSESRLDAQLCTADQNLVQVSDIHTRAVMFDPPESVESSLQQLKEKLFKGDQKVSSDIKIDPVRALLDRKMCSDHIALIGRYTVVK